MKAKNIIIFIVTPIVMFCAMVTMFILFNNNSNNIAINLFDFVKTYATEISTYTTNARFYYGASAVRVLKMQGYEENCDNVLSCLVADDVLIAEYSNVDALFKSDDVCYKMSVFNNNVVVYKKEIDYFYKSDLQVRNNVLYARNGTIAITDIESGSETISVVSSATIIGAYCFTANSNTLNYISLPEGLLQINSRPFLNNYLISEIELPATLKTFKSDSFIGINIEQYYRNINGLVVEDGVLFNQEKTKLYYYSKYKNASEYVIPASVTHISSYAFYDNNFIQSVVLHENIVDIGNNVFKNCDLLESINIQVTKITKIKENTFFKTSLNNVQISKNVEYIDGSAFGGCNHLINLSISDENQHYKILEGDIVSKDGKKLVCAVLEDRERFYTVPSGVESVLKNSIMSTRLESVVLGVDVSVVDWFTIEKLSLENLYITNQQALNSLQMDLDYVYCFLINKDLVVPNIILNSLFTKTNDTETRNLIIYDIWVNE